MHKHMHVYMRMNKPLIIMLETDRSHGGVPLSVHS